MNKRSKDAPAQFETYSREWEKVYEQTIQFNVENLIVKFFYDIGRFH